MNRWARFFLGTPQRAIVSLILLFIGGCLVNPAWGNAVLSRVQEVFYSLLNALLPIAIVVAVLTVMIRKLFK